MKFIVDQTIFTALPTACFGVVVARNINNHQDYPAIAALLAANLAKTEQCYSGQKVKELTAIRPYRESFHKLNLNPNKFMSSIEAMFTRVSKGKGLPSINPIVDLGNALSLKYTLPMGAHDLEQMDQDIQLRLSTPEDTFIPFGATEQQQMPADEPVYAVGQQIRTRRWIWQQSELGKITADSKDIFFPLDGFTDCNLPAITAAQQELAAFCRDQFNCTEIKIGLIDQQHPQMEL